MKSTFIKRYEQGDFIEVNGITCTVIVCAKDRALVASPKSSMPFWIEFRYLPARPIYDNTICYEG